VSLALSPDGSHLYLTAPVAGSSSLDYGITALDTTDGIAFWSQTYNGPAGQDDIPNAIAASPDGTRVFVTGSSVGVGTGTDIATLAYDSYNGHWLWTRRLDGSAHGNDSGNAVAVSPDSSKVAVAGMSVGSGTGMDFQVLEYASG
jgi:DNA-binding beta-propeller fold protein YncE